MKTFVIGLDLDDTLLPTAREYHRAMWQCGAIIDNVLGERSPHPKDIIDFQQRTDITLIEREGFKPDRFPTSWVMTLDHFAHLCNVAVPTAVSQAVFEAAQRFCQGPFRPFPGVLRTLTRLREGGHELHCISAGIGAESLQHRKLREADLTDFFRTITITGADKTPAMERVFNDRRERSVMVGDSKRHDILPAIALGVTAVWVPSSSWSFAQADVDPSTHYTIHHLTELPGLITRLNEHRPQP